MAAAADTTTTVTTKPPTPPQCSTFNNTAVNGTVACGTSNVVSAAACCSYCNSRCSNSTAWAYTDGTTGPSCLCYSNITAVVQRTGWSASVASTDDVIKALSVP